MALTREKANSISRAAAKLGISARDLATVISYETAGTFDPWKAGPTTQWGQHRGLIQWGDVQRKEYGVTKDMSFDQQMDAVVRYMQNNGVRPGMGLLDVYSAVNAGEVGLYNATDAFNGGAPGTVRDKVENQMAGHAAKADQLLAMASPDVQTQIAQADIPTPTEAPRGLLTAYDEPAPTFAENMRNTWLDGLFSTPSAQAQAQDAVDYMAAPPPESDPNAIHNQPWYEPTVKETIAQRVFSDWFANPSAAAKGVISDAKERDAFVPLTSPGSTMVPDSFQDVPIMSGGHLPLVNADAADPSPTLPISYDTMGVPDWAFQSSGFAQKPENHQTLPAQHPIYDQLLTRGAEYQQQPSSGWAGLFSTPSAAAADLPPQPAVPASVAANPESYLPGEMMLGDWASMPSMPSYAMGGSQPISGAGRQGEIRTGADGKQYQYVQISDDGTKWGWTEVNTGLQPPVQPLAPPKQVQQYNVASPQMPAPPPMPSGMDVWQGQSSYGMATDGSTLSRNPDGTVSRYSEQYDRWDTFNPETQQWLPGGGQAGSINLPSKDRLLSGGKNMAGSMAGGLLGSYLGGPIGGLLGAALGKSVAQGKGLQGIFGGDKTTVFPAAPGSGLTDPFPSAPRSPRGSGNSSSGSFGNSSYDDVYALSPDVADAIASGVGGLW